MDLFLPLNRFNLVDLPHELLAFRLILFKGGHKSAHVQRATQSLQCNQLVGLVELVIHPTLPRTHGVSVQHGKHRFEQRIAHFLVGNIIGPPADQQKIHMHDSRKYAERAILFGTIHRRLHGVPGPASCGIFAQERRCTAQVYRLAPPRYNTQAQVLFKCLRMYKSFANHLRMYKSCVLMYKRCADVCRLFKNVQIVCKPFENVQIMCVNVQTVCRRV